MQWAVSLSKVKILPIQLLHIKTINNKLFNTVNIEAITLFKGHIYITL